MHLFGKEFKCMLLLTLNIFFHRFLRPLIHNTYVFVFLWQYKQSINKTEICYIVSFSWRLLLALYVYFRSKPIVPYCDEIDIKKEFCSLEGFATNVCAMRKYKKLERMYQVGERNSDRRNKADACVCFITFMSSLYWSEGSRVFVWL